MVQLLPAWAQNLGPSEPGEIDEATPTGQREELDGWSLLDASSQAMANLRAFRFSLASEARIRSGAVSVVAAEFHMAGEFQTPDRMQATLTVSSEVSGERIVADVTVIGNKAWIGVGGRLVPADIDAPATPAEEWAEPLPYLLDATASEEDGRYVVSAATCSAPPPRPWAHGVGGFASLTRTRRWILPAARLG
jgi:hypothetical protein